MYQKYYFIARIRKQGMKHLIMCVNQPTIMNFGISVKDRLKDIYFIPLVEL